MRIFTLTLFLLFLISCSNDSPSENSSHSHISPISSNAFEVIGDYNGNTWDRQWTENVFQALEEQSSALLDNEVNSADLSAIKCSNFNQLSRGEKKMFWALFMSSISHFESSFNPNERYWERTMSKYSEGLFQLSTSDSNYYSYCDVTSSNILDPKENIRCAVSILDVQVEGSSRRESGRLFPSSYFYWSVLTRFTSKIKVQNFFKQRVESILPFCN